MSEARDDGSDPTEMPLSGNGIAGVPTDDGSGTPEPRIGAGAPVEAPPPEIGTEDPNDESTHEDEADNGKDMETQGNRFATKTDHTNENAPESEMTDEPIETNVLN